MVFKFKMLIIFLAFVLLAGLWVIPSIMLDRHPEMGAFGVLYFGDFVLSILWGIFLFNVWDDLR